MPETDFKIRVISPWFGSRKLPGVLMSVDIEPDEADALLCAWAPSEELFEFPRRKAWYCCEPHCQFRQLGNRQWPAIRDRLLPGEFLWHGHSDPRYRTPHATHFGEVQVNGNHQRKERAIAIVSNHGGNPWRRHPHITYRNRFITHPMVDLFGRSGWKHYRAGRFSRPKPPLNYQGGLPGDWPANEKRELMAQYQAAVCLENMNEPHYFTEKFVEAVCAGCVPIYKAHPTIKNTILQGAAWIDPTDYNDNPNEAIEAALSANRFEFTQANTHWLQNSGALKATHSDAIYTRIANILRHD